MTEIMIAGDTINPGQTLKINIPIAILPGQTMMAMPTIVIRGKKDGPILWVSSAVHGDEINGVEVISRLLDFICPENIKGTVIAVPIVNVFGFTQQSRYLPDRRDLNRCFPGSKNGSLASRLAHLFMTEIIAKATHGIDIHTGAVHRCNLIHVRCDPTIPENHALANAFGPPVILVNKSGKGTLRSAANKHNIPNLLIEMGEALRFNEDYIEECYLGVLRVMSHLGMLDADIPAPLVPPQLVHKTAWVRARWGGLFQPKLALGEKVKKGQILGRINDVMGKSRGKLVSPMNGIVIGMAKNPMVYQGDAMVHIALSPDG